MIAYLVPAACSFGLSTVKIFKMSMKKIFYFALAGLLTLSIVACDDNDDNTGGGKTKTLEANPTSLSFEAMPQAPLTIAVEAENVSWKATTEAAWLTLTDAEGTANGTIGVTAAANETSEPQNATIVIRAEGVDDVTVTVTQQAGEPAVIWERSSRSRMNFRGSVKTASFYGQYRENSLYAIHDLEFDSDGMLTAFTRDVSGTILSYTLSYDAQNRLTKCAWADADGNKSFELTYGDHGQYIHTENLFNDISFSAGVTDFILWMPRYIKNLSTVVCRTPYYRDPSVIDVYTYTIEVTGSTGKINLRFNDEPAEENAQLAFANGYNTQSVSSGFFGSTTDYTVNPANGNLLRSVSDDGYSVVTVTYNDDRINSLSEIQGDISTKLTYDGNLDVTCVTDPANGKSLALSYRYDALGNWTKMTAAGDLGDQAGTIERTVTYNE